MRVSTKYRFVFISTPKAGTHTIYQILKQHYPEGLKEGGFHSVKVPAAYRSFPRWTVVRNPFSRAVSLWWSTCRCHPEDRYRARRGCGAADDFPRFVQWMLSLEHRTRIQQPLFQSQADWLDPVQPIQALHLEQLEEELREQPWWKPAIVLPQLNTTDEKVADQEREEGSSIHRPPWEEMCADEAVREDIIKWAGRDFDLFGYSTQVG